MLIGSCKECSAFVLQWNQVIEEQKETWERSKPKLQQGPRSSFYLTSAPKSQPHGHQCVRKLKGAEQVQENEAVQGAKYQHGSLGNTSMQTFTRIARTRP